MKNFRGFGRLTAAAMAIILIMAAFPAAVQAATKIDAHVTDPTINAGATFTITYYVNNTGYAFCGLDGKINYDSSKLTFKSAGGVNGFSIEANDTSGAVNISISKASGITSGNFMTVSFVAKSAFSSGSTSISMSISSGTVLSGGTVSAVSSSECKSGSSTVRIKEAATTNPSTPPTGGSSITTQSSDSSLKAMSIDKGELSPAFSGSVTDYSVSVPYDTLNVVVTPTVNHQSATYEISEPTLTEGRTSKLTVTVTAQDGKSKTVYTINITVEKGPNYVPSANAYLANLTCEQGKLNPLFDKNTLHYTMMVPNECESVTIEASAEEADLAVCNISGPSVLTAGKENLFRIVCTAEDAKTANIYTITVIRMQNYEYYVSDEYLTEISKKIRAGETPITLDMRYCPCAMVDSYIFTSIGQKEGMILTVLSANASVSFKSEDILNETKRENYDLGVSFVTDHSESISSLLASYATSVFEINCGDTLPGYGNFSIFTDLQAGKTVNVYRYDKTNDSYIHIAKNIAVNEGGAVSFDADCGGEYVITEKLIENAVGAEALKRNKTPLLSLTGNGLYIAFGLCAVIFLAAGILIGCMIKKNSPSTPRGSKETPEEYPEEYYEEEVTETEENSDYTDNDGLQQYEESEEYDNFAPTPSQEEQSAPIQDAPPIPEEKPKKSKTAKKKNNRRVFEETKEEKSFEKMLDDLVRYKKKNDIDNES